jgi:type II secretory pathway component PulK
MNNLNIKNNKKGVALLMILGVIATLAILLTASLSIIGMRIKVVNYKNNMLKAKMITKSVQTFAGYVLMTDSNEYDSLDDIWADSPDLFTGVYDENSSWSIIGHVSENSVTNFGFVDEESKLNIKNAPIRVLNRFFEYTAGLDSEEAFILAASIEQKRIENMIAYSNTFQSIYELLYVPEMKQKTFDSIENIITVYGNGKLNVNTVNKNVLLAFVASEADLKTSESFVDKLLIFRNQGNIIKAKNDERMKEALKAAIPMTKQEISIVDNLYTNLTSKSTIYKGNLYIDIDGKTQQNTFIVNKQNGKIISSLTLLNDEL